MYDPHFVALIYRVEHDEHVDYKNASPMEFEAEAFRVRLADCRARFEMKDHCASEKEARQIVDPFVRAWEIKAAIATKPGVFCLEFDHAEIIDRAPSGRPNRVRDFEGVTSEDTLGIRIQERAVVHMLFHSYPDPPTDFDLTSEVEMMAQRYVRYRQGRELITSAAYWIKTVLDACSPDAETRPANYFQISQKAIDTVRGLSSRKGGEEARKYDAHDKPLTAQEREWLDAAMRAIILRVAAKAANPEADLPPITMADLPPLT